MANKVGLGWDSLLKMFHNTNNPCGCGDWWLASWVGGGRSNSSGHHGHGKCHWILACGCSVPIPDRAPGRLNKRSWNADETQCSKPWLYPVYGGIIFPSYIGIIISVYKRIPMNQPISIMNCHHCFERCSIQPNRQAKASDIFVADFGLVKVV